MTSVLSYWYHTREEGIDFMNLIYGTYNPSKLESMRKVLDGLNLCITGIGTLENTKERGIYYEHKNDASCLYSNRKI